MTTPQNEPAPLVPTGQLAQALGVAGHTIRRWRHEGHITPSGYTLGGRARWDVEAVRAQISRLQEQGR